MNGPGNVAKAQLVPPLDVGERGMRGSCSPVKICGV